MELSASIEGERMNSLDKYLSQVSRHLIGLTSSVREDVLMELRSHILAQAEADGSEVDSVIERMGPAKETARSYVGLYGYGPGTKIVAISTAAFLAFLSLPFTLVTSAFLGTEFLSNAALIFLFLLLVAAGVKVGRKTALLAGSGAAITRLGALGVAYVVEGSTLLREPLVIVAFVLTTAVLVLVGYLAGPGKRSSAEVAP